MLKMLALIAFILIVLGYIMILSIEKVTDELKKLNKHFGTKEDNEI